MKFKKLTAMVLVLGMMFSIAACSTSGTETTTANTTTATTTKATEQTTVQSTSEVSSEPIRIGLAVALTTDANLGDIFTIRGAEMAVDEINANGGIDGRQIEVYKEDTANTPAACINAYNKLIEENAVVAIIGPSYSSQLLAIQPIVTEKKIPVFGLGTNVKLTQDFPWYIRMRPSDAIAAKAAAEFALNSLGKQKIGVSYVSNEFGMGGKDIIVETLKEYGIEPVAIETYNTEDRDYSALLYKMQEAGADVLINWGNQQNDAALWVQNKKLETNIPMISCPGSLAQSALDIAEGASNGNYAVTDVMLATKEDQKIKDWCKKYEDMYGEIPEPHVNAAYDAVYLIKYGIEKSGSTDAKAIIDEILALRDYQGISGTFSFSQGTGDGLSSVDIIQFDKKTPVFVDHIEAN